MKILSWNIEAGGFGAYDPSLRTPERLQGIAAKIRKINADVIGLIDTFNWRVIFNEERLRETFGYPHVWNVDLDDSRLNQIGHDNGITVLARGNLGFRTVRISSRNCVITTLDLGDKKIDIVSAYLDDLSEDVRLAQIRELLSQIGDRVPVVIGGDLNTIDITDKDGTKNNLQTILGRVPQNARAGMESVANEMLRCEVTIEIRNAGFKDFGAGKGNTFPTPLSTFPVDEPMARVDYMWGRGVKCRKFEVLKDKEFDNLSDHYPILVEVEI